MATSTYIKALNGYKINDVESIHGLAVEGQVITYTKGDGTTGTITTKDTTYAAVVAGSETAGLMTGADKTKLEGVATGAEANQNAFSNVKSGTTTITASGKTDTIEVVGSGLITVTPDATNKKLTISTTANNYEHPTSGVTAGTYKSVTVDANGHITAGTNPTTLAGYGVTDAKIDTGVITLGGNTITPLTATSTLDATKLSGMVPIESIPAAALERCVVVADDTARLALTEENVQVGDTVKVTGTGKMYFVKDSAKLNSEDGYEVYVAGTAASVDWSGVTNVPNYAGSSSKGGSATSAAKLDSNAGSETQPIYFANGVPVATTYALNATVPADAVFTDTHYEAKAVVGASATAKDNATATNGNVYMNVVENDTVRSATKIVGSGATSVVSDANGVITISSTNDNTTYTGSDGITLTGTNFTNSGVRSVSTGTTNGTISVNTNGTAAEVAVAGLKSGAFTEAYVLPTATTSVKGGVLVGSNLNVSSGTISAKTLAGATATAAGTAGYAPAPAAGDNVKFLRGDANWASIALNITDDGDGNITFGLVTQP